MTNTTTTVGTGCETEVLEVEGHGTFEVRSCPRELILATEIEEGDVLLFRGTLPEVVEGAPRESGGRIVFPTRRLQYGEARTGTASPSTRVARRTCSCRR